jgi:RNA recognition motif-containing protein
LEKNGLNGIDFDARLAVDKETGTPRGFGFISVFNKEHVKSVLKLNGREFLRRKLVINESKSK